MLDLIYNKMSEKKDKLDQWFAENLGDIVPPIYSSADIRYTGYKISVIDTNLFPSGFNNLCETFTKQAVTAFSKAFARYSKAPQQVLIIPEAHTRNPYYWANIESLMNMLKRAGAVPVVGRCPEIGVDLPATLNLPDGSTLELPLVERKDNVIWAGDSRPDIVLLNNDFSQEFPEMLCGVRQAVMPSPQLGWHQRSKSDHFEMYTCLIEQVASILELDPWILSPLMSKVEKVNIHEESGRLRFKECVDSLIEKIRRKHQEYNIDSEPYVFIKDDSGTYGMGVAHVMSGDEVMNMGRRTRNKLSSSKSGKPVTDFLIQEGLPTIQQHQKRPLEPVVYLVDGEAIGQFFRIHDKKSDRDSLNARGMSFDCLCSHKLERPEGVTSIDCESPDTMRTVSGLLARVASYAASLELEELRSKQQVVC